MKKHPQIIDLRDAKPLSSTSHVKTVKRRGVTPVYTNLKIDGLRPAKRDISKIADAVIQLPISPTKLHKQTIKRKIFSVFQYVVIAVVAVSAAYSSGAGQIIVLIFAVICISQKLDSKYTFGSALFIISTIPLFLAIDQTGIAENAALYVYQLLFIGTFQVLLGIRKYAFISD